MGFSVSVQSSLPAERVVEEILNVSNWPGFKGWGPVPGIQSAQIVERTDALIGTRIAVTNSDGSTHEETVTDYVPGQRLVMKIENFSPPLRKLARYFTETWQFEQHDRGTNIERTFELYPKGLIGKLILLPIEAALHKAVAAHTRTLAGQGDD